MRHFFLREDFLLELHAELLVLKFYFASGKRVFLSERNGMSLNKNRCNIPLKMSLFFYLKMSLLDGRHFCGSLLIIIFLVLYAIVLYNLIFQHTI